MTWQAYVCIGQHGRKHHWIERNAVMLLTRILPCLADPLSALLEHLGVQQHDVSRGGKPQDLGDGVILLLSQCMCVRGCVWVG
jgi:hypothetical protein